MLPFPVCTVLIRSFVVACENLHFLLVCLHIQVNNIVQIHIYMHNCIMQFRLCVCIYICIPHNLHACALYLCVYLVHVHTMSMPALAIHIHTIVIRRLPVAQKHGDISACLFTSKTKQCKQGESGKRKMGINLRKK